MNFLKVSYVLLLLAALNSTLYPMEQIQLQQSDYHLHDQCIVALLEHQGPVDGETLLRICDETGISHDKVMPYAGNIINFVQQLKGRPEIANNSTNAPIIQAMLRASYPSLGNEVIASRAQSILLSLHKRSCDERHTVDQGTNTEPPLAKHSKKEVVAGSTQAEVPSQEHPIFGQTFLVETLAQFLPIKDRFNLARGSKNLLSVMRGQTGIKAETDELMLQKFMRETKNPIEYIIAKAHGTSPVSIDGINFPTQQVLDYLYDHNAEILIANRYNPILYVLNTAATTFKGRKAFYPNITINGKKFYTLKLLQELYRHGADIHKIGDYSRSYRKGNYPVVHDEGGPITPILNKIILPKEVYEQLTAEQRLDAAEWHQIEATNNADILEQCRTIARDNPQDGIGIYCNEGDVIFSAEFLDQLAQFNIVYLHCLDSVTDFPDGIQHIGKLRHLRELYIYGTPCPDDHILFPKEFCELTELRSIFIGYYGDAAKHETTIPEEICHLQKLRFLDLRTFLMKRVPASIGQLKHLRLLILDSDLLEALPDTLRLLTNLSFFDCSASCWSDKSPSHSSLSELPSSLWHLKKLQELRLCYNKLATLPDEIKHLTSLQRLFIDGNNFKQIPDAIRHVPALNDFSSDDTNRAISFALLEYLVTRVENVEFGKLSKEHIRTILDLRKSALEFANNKQPCQLKFRKGIPTFVDGKVTYRWKDYALPLSVLTGETISTELLELLADATKIFMTGLSQDNTFNILSCSREPSQP